METIWDSARDIENVTNVVILLEIVEWWGNMEISQWSIGAWIGLPKSQFHWWNGCEMGNIKPPHILLEFDDYRAITSGQILLCCNQCEAPCCVEEWWDIHIVVWIFVTHRWASGLMMKWENVGWWLISVRKAKNAIEPSIAVRLAWPAGICKDYGKSGCCHWLARNSWKILWSDSFRLVHNVMLHVMIACLLAALLHEVASLTSFRSLRQQAIITRGHGLGGLVLTWRWKRSEMMLQGSIIHESQATSQS